jgi:long-chain acyl-CoA synthetase
MQVRHSSAEIARFESLKEEFSRNGSFIFAGTLLKRAATRFAQSPALVTDEKIMNYAELYGRATAVTLRLREMGIKPGDRICILFENSIDFYIAYYGAWQTGAVVAPLNTYLHEKEIDHIISDAQPKVLIAGNQLADKIKQIARQLPPLIVGNEMAQFRMPSEDQLKNLEIPNRDQDDIAVILYTSGTTGVPKGVMLSTRCIITNIIQGIALIDVHPDDRVLGVLPFFHSFAQFACVWGNLMVGASVIVVPKVDRKDIIHGLRHKPTAVLGVPALYGLFCLMRTVDFSTVRYFVSGGDAMPDKIRTAFEIIYRRKISNGFGMTETSPLIAINFDEELCDPNTVGRPAIGIDCSIRDDNNNELAYGQKGVLWVKGDNVMLGYYNAPEQTAAVMKDGWLNTGDCAYFDNQGRLVIYGRERDIIKNKGLIIYPQEIENIIMGYTAVLKVAVVGKKDESIGEIPVAFVALREKVPNIEKILKELCVRNLAPYKIPRSFIVMDDLPMTALGKIDKKKLRVQLANHTIRD